MFITVTLDGGLHQRPDTRAMVNEIRAQTGGATLPRVRHACKFRLYGRWREVDRDSERTINSDNFIKPLFDSMAEAFGLGKNGRGDEYLDRVCDGWECVESDRWFAEIEIRQL